MDSGTTIPIMRRSNRARSVASIPYWCWTSRKLNGPFLGWKKMDQPNPAGPGAASVGRSDRPLGRGLEDVSHVFLSPQADEAGAEPRGARRSTRPFPRQDSSPSTGLLRPAVQVTREQVAAALNEF